MSNKHDHPLHPTEKAAAEPETAQHQATSPGDDTDKSASNKSAAKSAPGSAKTDKTAKATKPKSTTPPAQGKPGERNGNSLVLLLGLLLLLALGAGYYLWQQQQLTVQQGQALQVELSGLQAASEQAWQQQQAAQLQQAQQLRTQAAHLRQLEQQVQSLRGHIPRQLQEWELAEVAYLLRIAEHRLHLERQPRSALSALQAAAETLAVMDQPHLAPLKRALAEDIQRVAVLGRGDVQQLASQLSGLMVLVDALPMKKLGAPIAEPQREDAMPEAQQGRWQRILRQVWNDLRELVVVRHQQDTHGRVMHGQQLELVMAMRLEAAQLALLSGQRDAWQQNLQAAQAWLVMHFEPHAPAYQQLEQGLADLLGQDPWPSYPSLEETGQLLERLLMTQSGSPFPAAEQDTVGDERR
ncbi:MAG: uroporphyrinogen-III C-methyltransferase [Thiohalomonadaceae bacterium]